MGQGALSDAQLLWNLTATVFVLVAVCLWRWGRHWFATLDTDLHRHLVLTIEDPSSLQPVPTPSILSPASKTLSVVIPAYNEEERLPGTLEEALSYLKSRRDREGPHFTYEIIVVDDGSQDQTSRLVHSFTKRHGIDAVRVVKLPSNKGKGYAVRQGMLLARGQLCLMADADGATKFAEVDKLEAAVKKIMIADYRQDTNGKSDGRTGHAPLGLQPPAALQLGVAVGSRAHLEKAALAKRSPWRNFLMRGFHGLVIFVAGSAVRDTQCGFKLFTRRTAACLYNNQRLHRWCFDVELLLVAQMLAIPVSEVHVTWTEVPGSKIRFTSVLHMAFELLALKLAYQWFNAWTVRTESSLTA